MKYFKNSFAIATDIDINNLYLSKKNSLIKIIGINYKDKRDNALKFLDEYENPYLTILTDNNGIVSIEIGAYGIPESFILNKEKKIIKKIIGPIDRKKFNEIKELIKK